MKKDINVEIGARIKEKRRALKYTREALSEIIDISPQFLADIECGKKGMSFTTLTKLCGVLGVSCDYIILGKAPDRPHGRIDELIAGIGDEYIPLVEGMLGEILQIIAIAKKTNAKPTSSPCDSGFFN